MEMAHCGRCYATVCLAPRSRIFRPRRRRQKESVHCERRSRRVKGRVGDASAPCGTRSAAGSLVSLLHHLGPHALIGSEKHTLLAHFRDPELLQNDDAALSLKHVCTIK